MPVKYWYFQMKKNGISPSENKFVYYNVWRHITNVETIENITERPNENQVPFWNVSY